VGPENVGQPINVGGRFDLADQGSRRAGLVQCLDDLWHDCRHFLFFNIFRRYFHRLQGILVDFCLCCEILLKDGNRLKRAARRLFPDVEKIERRLIFLVRRVVEAAPPDQRDLLADDVDMHCIQADRHFAQRLIRIVCANIEEARSAVRQPHLEPDNLGV